MGKPVEFVTDGNILKRCLGPGGGVVIPDGIAFRALDRRPPALQPSLRKERYDEISE